MTSSNASLTSSLIQSFSPGVTLLSCTSAVEHMVNGNFAYSIVCTNDTGGTVDFEVEAQPAGCCEGTDDAGMPNQLRCDQEVVVVEDDPDTEEFDPVTAIESVCTDYLTDLNNCGGCGNVCGDDEICNVGQCESICDAGEMWCGAPNDPDDIDGICADLETNAGNCGVCGNECGYVNSTVGRVDKICVASECELCPIDARTRCGDICVDLGPGETCESAAPAAPIVGSTSRYGESRALPTPAYRVKKTASFSADSKLLPPGVPDPAPLCETLGETLQVPTGEAITECVASPNLPIEVNGTITACGGLIPEGSPLCGGGVGTSGIFQRFEPGTELPTEIELSMVGIQLNDGDDGNGLIEAGETVCMTIEVANAGTASLKNVQATLKSDPVDLDCGQIVGGTCVPDNSDMASVVITIADAAYPDLPGVTQIEPENTSCFDDDGNRLPAAVQSQGSSLTEFCVTVPANHPGDIVRPFELEITGLGDNDDPFVVDVPFSLGIAAACDLGPGGFPEGVDLGSPFAPLVPVEEPPAFPEVTFTTGDTLPLGIGLSCSGATIGDSEIPFGPRVVALTGEMSGDLTPDDGGFAFDPTTGLWNFDLPTADLLPDVYLLTIRINDTKDYHTGFVLCGDTDGDGVNDCNDSCIADPGKDDPGICGCGVSDDDSDGDGVADCDDTCAADAGKTEPGICGCGVSDDDSDGDEVADCNDACAADASKVDPGICGCGISDADSDGDGVADCNDACAADPGKIDPGICGCGISDADSDEDGVADCNDACADDANKTEPGICGCGIADDDRDDDGVADCNDTCPDDANKVDPEVCGCGTAETDTDADGNPDCIDPCGNGRLDEGEECDDGNATDGDGCDVVCFFEMDCELSVVKTCFAPDDGDDDDDDDDCAGQVTALKLEYTGAGCDGLSNLQGGKAECAGDVGGAEPVRIRVTDSRGRKVYADEAVVLLGDIIEATAANAGENKFSATTEVLIDDGVESVLFHTSCSKPLRVGDQFGSVRLVELTSTKKGTVTMPDPELNPGDGTQICSIPALPPEPHCEGKVQVLGMRYVNRSCAESIQDQGDKFRCNGDVAGSEPVRVVCTKDGDSSRVFLDTGDPASVYPGDVVEISAAAGGRSELHSSTTCSIYDEFGGWLQDISLHTSCSRPLNLNDRFGALQVVSLDTTGRGPISVEHEVVYTYKITNHTPVPAVDVSVVDDQLGEVPGSPISVIEPGDTVVLKAVALIENETTNVVTVDGFLSDGRECPTATDHATVVVEEPQQACRSALDALLLMYVGPEIAGPVTIEVVPRKGESPAIYEFENGLATGTMISSPAENGWTVASIVRGEDQLGSKTSLIINGVEEVIHTSCSVSIVVDHPAPLDDPKGAPSPDWVVMGFTEK